MKLQHLLYTGCYLLLACLPPAGAHAQGKLKTFNSCSSSTIYRLALGDTILVQCDSSVLLSKQNFSKYRQGNTGELLRSYEMLITEQDSMLRNSQRDYNALKLKFDTLYQSSLAQLDRTSKDIVVVKDGITSVSNNLTQTQVLIGDAIKQVNAERRKSFLNKFFWGLGGLGIGVSLTAILMAAN